MSRRTMWIGLGAALLTGLTGCGGGTAGNAASSGSASGSRAGVATSATPPSASGSTAPVKTLALDCGALMPKTRALLQIPNVKDKQYVSPAEGSMPTSKEEWAHKNFDTYPGVTCTFDADSSDNLSNLVIEVFPPATWYRDNILFQPPLGEQCSPTTLPGAAKAQWCHDDGGAGLAMGNLSADANVALIDLQTLRDNKALPAVSDDQVKAAIEQDLAAQTYP